MRENDGCAKRRASGAHTQPIARASVYKRGIVIPFLMIPPSPSIITENGLSMDVAGDTNIFQNSHCLNLSVKHLSYITSERSIQLTRCSTLLMDKRELQQEYIKHHASHIVSFAKTGHARYRRGIILIGWPSLNLRHITDEFAYLPEKEVKQRLKKLQAPGEPNLADQIIQAVQQYDPTWEAVLLFLDDVNKTSDLHVAGFLPHRPFTHLLMPSSLTATGH